MQLTYVQYVDVCVFSSETQSRTFWMSFVVVVVSTTPNKTFPHSFICLYVRSFVRWCTLLYIFAEQRKKSKNHFPNDPSDHHLILEFILRLIFLLFLFSSSLVFVYLRFKCIFFECTSLSGCVCVCRALTICIIITLFMLCTIQTLHFPFADHFHFSFLKVSD